LTESADDGLLKSSLVAFEIVVTVCVVERDCRRFANVVLSVVAIEVVVTERDCRRFANVVLSVVAVEVVVTVCLGGRNRGDSDVSATSFVTG
jgi:hypothetical protein